MTGPLYVYRDYHYKAHSFEEMRNEAPLKKKLALNPIRRAHTHVCSRSSFVMKENRVSVADHRTAGDDGGTRIFICSCGSTIWQYSGDTTFVGRKQRARTCYPQRLTPGLQEF